MRSFATVESTDAAEETKKTARTAVRTMVLVDGAKLNQRLSPMANYLAYSILSQESATPKGHT